jgi:trans-2,3-dihydro-3-hydroxyanthranilate isomerase
MSPMIAFALVDAFTDQPFAGNTAGAVSAAEGLSSDQMQRIARELGQTETCFMSATDEPGADLALRWFTPTVEVDLCGHATIAAFIVLASEGRVDWSDGHSYLCCATRTGTIGVWLERKPSGSPRVMMSVGVASLEPAPEDRSTVARAVGLAPSALDDSLPLVSDRGSARLIIPVARLGDLLRLEPDGTGMIAHGKQSGYRRFTLVCRDTNNPHSFVHLRHFAPANGIPEDPVTGTAHAAAAIYLDREGLLPLGDRVVLTGEQGHAVGRRGEVTVELLRQASRITDVRIGGTAVIVGHGELVAPPRHS